MSSGIGLLNSHTLSQFNESSHLNKMNMGVENFDVNGGNCYMNIITVFEANNHNSIYSTKKIDEIYPYRSEIENTGLRDGVDIYAVIPLSTLNLYANMEYNNKHHKLLINGKFLTSNNSTVSTLTSPFITSTNYKVCSLFSPIHDNIKYSD